MATQHLETYREALAIAYAGELRAMSTRGVIVLDVFWIIRVRYRAARKAIRVRRRLERQAAGKAAEEGTAAAKDAPPTAAATGEEAASKGVQ